MPVADSVMGYVLAFARQLPWMDRQMKAGTWHKILGRSLSESTLGIIGFGNIGQAVARRAKAFGMKVLANDIIRIEDDVIKELGVRMVKKVELLRESDFVSLNCDLNETSRHLINNHAFESMKTSGVVINTARGPIIDESALISALETGRIAGAALDVFEAEPLSKTSPLLRMPNVLLAPHNSNSSPGAWKNVHENTIKNLFEVLESQP
jgi:D-3-phosphoglycerate dehydrogenase